MKVFKCILSGDEMFTDTFAFEEKNGFYVVKGKFVTVKTDDVDDRLIGGNPSAEGGDDEGAEGGVESGVDIILGSRMKETGFGTKKEYGVYMKEYMANVMSKLKEKNSTDEQIADAKAGAAAAFKEAYGKFKELQFYSGEGEDPDGHIALLEWIDGEEDGKPTSTPYMYFYKAGLVAEKL